MGVDARIGASLRDYRLDSLLGRGGMSVVYLAEDRRLGRKVALKLLSLDLADDERFRDRFLRESRLAASLDHPNVIPVYEAGDEDGQLFIAMRYVEGADLKRLLLEHGKLDADRAVRIVSEVAAALDAAHEAGLVHRDVKPANVLLDRSGHAYLCDFGLTKQASSVSGLTGTGQLVGTLEYLAPEQIRGEQVDGRADVYALGCVLYECLAGAPPFRRETEAATLWAHVQEPAPSLRSARPELPRAVDDVVAKSLAKDPAARYATAGALADELRSALAGELRVRRRPRLRMLVAACAVGLAFVIAAVLGFALTRGGGAVAVKPNSVAVIDAKTNRVVGDVSVGVHPSAIAIGEGAVWVANAVDHTISRIDPKTRDVVRTIPVAEVSVPALAAGAGGVWVTSWTGLLLRIDPTRNEVDGRAMIGRWNAQSPPTTPDAVAVAVGGGVVWIGDRVGLVSRVDPVTLKVLERVDVRTAVTAIAVGRASTWVAQARQNTVRRISASASSVTGSFTVGAGPVAIALGERAVWVTAREDDVVTRIDPFTKATKTIPVGDEPSAIAVGDGSVWVASSRSYTVSRIDPAAGAVSATLTLPAVPTAIAFRRGQLWVAVAARAS